MDYNAILHFLYPNAQQGTDYYLYFQQGNTVPTLGNWNATKLGPQPTLAELQQAWPSVQLYQAQQQQLTLLSNNAKQAIIGGFSSAALGSTHLYPSGETDQLNLTASVVASMLPGVQSTFATLFYCASGSPAVWAFTPHTAAQIQQVGTDAKAWIQAQQATHAELAAQVASATTISAVQAVVWP